jgi:hypothetical protein
MDMSCIPEFDDAKVETIKPGNIDNTNWIQEGWKRMNRMITEKGYKVKQPVR